jgi:3-oxoacyl-[acyl-carrier-protein] synthase-1
MSNPKSHQENFQRPTRPVEITAAGMITSVGANAEMTAASVRSGISAYQESPILNKDFNPMIMSLVPEDALPELEDGLKQHALTSRQQRMLRLAAPAIQSLADKLDSSVPLMLAGPEKLPGRRSVISDNFLNQLLIQSKVPIDLENSYIFPYGRAGGFYALEAAMQLLESGTQGQVIVGGLDSFLDLYLLGTLDRDDRVLAEGVMDGFAPGEAAAFLLLRLADDGAGMKVFPPGLADEPGHRYSGQPYKGEGLANAVTEALVNLQPVAIRTVLASFNGENCNAKEWGVAAIRNHQYLDADFSIIHPADCYGDIGAATGPVLMALASIGIQKGFYLKPVLVWASSEMQQRAAVYMV